MSIAAELHDIFAAKEYLWMVGGERVVPSEDDIQKALDTIKSMLDVSPDIGSLEVGRIRVQRTDVGLEVYIFMGDM